MNMKTRKKFLHCQAKPWRSEDQITAFEDLRRDGVIAASGVVDHTSRVGINDQVMMNTR